MENLREFTPSSIIDDVKKDFESVEMVEITQLKQRGHKALSSVRIGNSEWKAIIHLRDAVPMLLLVLTISMGGYYA